MTISRWALAMADLEEQLEGGDASLRRAGDDVGADRADRGELGEVPLAEQGLAGLLHPVLGEDRLQGADGRPFEAHAGVAPVLLVLAAAGPLLGDAVAEDVGDAAVEDRQLAVRAVVEVGRAA